MTKAPQKIQALETSLALLLILLLTYHFAEVTWPIYAAMAVTLLAMIWTLPFQWLAKFWFGLGHVMGLIVSTIILSAIYFFVISPMGWLYRIFTKNPLKIQPEKDSLFVERNHKFQAKDLERIF